MSDCPSCGRYVGPYETCPYCGAHIAGRIPIRMVKLIAVALATLGLAALWLAATRLPVPLLQVAEAGATTNMAYVRVEGRVVRAPNYDPESGYLAFTLDDGTGEIRVSAYRSESAALRAAGRVPALGDWVSVEGTLQVREESLALTVNVPERVEVQRPEAQGREIGSITADDRLQRVRVRGQVWAVRQPYAGLTVITLRDAGGLIDVSVGPEVQALTGALPPVEPGQSLEVTGVVDLYRDAAQLLPVSAQDVVLLPEPVELAALTTVEALSAGNEGELVALEGLITAVEPFAAGVKLTLDDGSGRVTVVLWQDACEQLADPAALAAGAEVRVMGEVSVYWGQLELLIARPVDVAVLASVSTGPLEAIGALTVERLGERVTVEGQVVAVESFSGGLRLALDDGSGQVELLLWDGVYDQLAGAEGLGEGAWLRAGGRLDEYAGRLQLAPQTGAEVMVLAPATAPARREIGSLSAADAGARVMVSGTVTRVESFSGGRRAWLRDGSGEVLVLLWAGVERRVAGAEGLAAGAALQISGVVEEYQGVLEVVPRLPGEVSVGE